MKEECLYKNFLPNTIVEKIYLKKRKEDKKNLWVLSIIFLILFPLSIEKINAIEHVPKKKNVEKQLKEGISVSQIQSWINLYFGEMSGEFNKEEGNIIVNNEDKINEMCNEKGFKIKAVESNLDNTYKVTFVKR